MEDPKKQLGEVQAAAKALLDEWWGPVENGPPGRDAEWDRDRLHERIKALARAVGLPIPPWAE